MRSRRHVRSRKPSPTSSPSTIYALQEVSDSCFQLRVAYSFRPPQLNYLERIRWLCDFPTITTNYDQSWSSCIVAVNLSAALLRVAPTSNDVLRLHIPNDALLISQLMWSSRLSQLASHKLARGRSSRHHNEVSPRSQPDLRRPVTVRVCLEQNIIYITGMLICKVDLGQPSQV